MHTAASVVLHSSEPVGLCAQSSYSDVQTRWEAVATAVHSDTYYCSSFCVYKCNAPILANAAILQQRLTEVVRLLCTCRLLLERLIVAC